MLIKCYLTNANCSFKSKVCTILLSSVKNKSFLLNLIESMTSLLLLYTCIIIIILVNKLILYPINIKGEPVRPPWKITLPLLIFLFIPSLTYLFSYTCYFKRAFISKNCFRAYRA